MVTGVTSTASSGKRDRNWLAIAGFITFAYFAALGSIFGFRRIWMFLTTSVNLNEIGDFLAGVFAPIALIWLVAAVLTQRQELDDAREQFKESQGVINAQLDAVKAQNQNAQDQAVRDYKLSLFEPRMEVFNKLDDIAQDYANKDRFLHYMNDLLGMAQRSAFLFGDDVVEYLDALTNWYEKLHIVDRSKMGQAMVDTAAQMYLKSMEADEAKEYAETVDQRKELIESISAYLGFETRSAMFEKYLKVTDTEKEKKIAGDFPFSYSIQVGDSEVTARSYSGGIDSFQVQNRESQSTK